jgi:SAM-dependent methyltransferase
MRITYRWSDNNQYWTKRWDDIPADHPMENIDVYPLKYAELTLVSAQGKILEAGCGAGRVLRYYADKGRDIIGIDFIKGAIDKLKEKDGTLKVEVGDISRLRFADAFFDYVLAFGLYHNLENNLEAAIKETFRVLRPGGKVCASHRADNIQTLLTDWLYARSARKRGITAPPDKFHKRNLKEKEFVELFSRAGFLVERVYPVENMPFFYKFGFFRDKRHKTFDENLGRKEGYRLSALGRALQKTLICLFPKQFCNIFVLIARKP